MFLLISQVLFTVCTPNPAYFSLVFRLIDGFETQGIVKQRVPGVCQV